MSDKDAGRRSSDRLRGFFAGVVSAAIVVVYLVVDRPSGQPEVMSGTVEQVSVEVRKVRGTYLLCRVIVSNGAKFETPCNFKPGAHVTVLRFRRRFSGASVYELRRF